MFKHLSVFIISTFFFWSAQTFKTNEIKDYCQGEVFRTQCSEDEVVIMKVALYGRMRIARCVKQDMGHMGCQANVIDLADAMCSGRRKCEIKIPDMTFEKTEPCLELQSYLEAAYECHRVVAVDKDDCMNSRHLKTTTPSGSIASVTVTETYCGTRDSSWVIQGLKGQQINLTLIDYSAPRRNITTFHLKNVVHLHTTPKYVEPVCHKYATIEEKGDGGTMEDKVTNVCGKKQRYQELYTSQGHIVYVSLEARKNNDQFLINYQITGCADPILSSNSKFKKDSPQKGTIWCQPSNEVWEVHCSKGQWQGFYSNCTDASMGETIGRASDYSSSSRTILLTVSVLLVVFVVVIVVIIVIYCRRYRYNQHPHHHHHHHQCEYPTPISIKSKSSLYGASEDDLEHHHHHHHQHQSFYNTRSLRYGHHHGQYQHHHQKEPQQQYERNRRSDSPCSRGGYSDYSAANYEKMDEDAAAESLQVPPLPVKMKSSSAKTSAVNLNTSTGEKVTHIWEMPLPVPGE